MRFLYSCMLYLLAPLVFARLAWRGVRAPAYLHRWSERLGYFPALGGERPIWVHAVSVGETLAALPLIRALIERHPDVPILVTTMTPTGSERVRAALGDRVHHVYVPYDLPGAVRRFLDRTRPRIALVMETEIWPNLYYQLERRRVPLLVLNARLSARSAAGYRRLQRLIAPAITRIDCIAAQSHDDAAHFIMLGAAAEQLRVTGSIKFDLDVPSDATAAGRSLRQRLGERPVWIAASTHDGEEAQVLAAFRKVRQQEPGVVLMLVPRHPERFDKVGDLCREQGWRLARRSKDEGDGETDIYLGDTMGELMRLYAAADVAFVGGSLTPVGGHNLLEPAALGLPVVTGEHVFNFRQITDMLIAGGAAERVETVDELALAVIALLASPAQAQRMGAAGRAVVEANRGALGRCLALIEERL